MTVIDSRHLIALLCYCLGLLTPGKFDDSYEKTRVLRDLFVYPKILLVVAIGLAEG